MGGGANYQLLKTTVLNSASFEEMWSNLTSFEENCLKLALP